MFRIEALIIILLSCAFLFWGGGCATVPPYAYIPNLIYYKSDDYIVYQLRTDDSPELLAERFLGDPRKDWLIEEANPGMVIEPGRFVVIPIKPRNPGGITSEGIQIVPILCYHRFGSHCGSSLCVPEDIFEQQMRFLKTNGYKTISPQELLGYLEYKHPLPKKSVMITVDDGYRSFYTVAYPILKKYGFTATMFVYTNFVEVSSKAITWDQLRELKANGFSIGSHSIAHSDLSKQGENESHDAYKSRLWYEIFNSKKIIDDQLDQDTLFFAYPFGRASQEAMTMVQQAGYQLAVTVNRGGNAFFSQRYLLYRDQVIKWDLASFQARLNTFYSIRLR